MDIFTRAQNLDEPFIGCDYLVQFIMLLLFISVFPTAGETCAEYIKRCRENKNKILEAGELLFIIDLFNKHDNLFDKYFTQDDKV